MSLKKINVVLEKSLLVRLDKRAQSNMRSRSCLLRDIIREYMLKEAKQPKNDN